MKVNANIKLPSEDGTRVKVASTESYGRCMERVRQRAAQAGSASLWVGPKKDGQTVYVRCHVVEGRRRVDIQSGHGNPRPLEASALQARCEKEPGYLPYHVFANDTVFHGELCYHATHTLDRDKWVPRQDQGAGYCGIGTAASVFGAYWERGLRPPVAFVVHVFGIHDKDTGPYQLASKEEALRKIRDSIPDRCLLLRPIPHARYTMDRGGAIDVGAGARLSSDEFFLFLTRDAAARGEEGYVVCTDVWEEGKEAERLFVRRSRDGAITIRTLAEFKAKADKVLRVCLRREFPVYVIYTKHNGELRQACRLPMPSKDILSDTAIPPGQVAVITVRCTWITQDLKFTGVKHFSAPPQVMTEERALQQMSDIREVVRDDRHREAVYATVGVLKDLRAFCYGKKESFWRVVAGFTPRLDQEFPAVVPRDTEPQWPQSRPPPPGETRPAYLQWEHAEPLDAPLGGAKRPGPAQHAQAKRPRPATAREPTPEPQRPARYSTPDRSEAAPEPPPPLFQGLVFYVWPRTGPVNLRLLQFAIRSHGGRVAHAPGDSVQYIVADGREAEELLPRCATAARVVPQDWVRTMIDPAAARGRLQDAEPEAVEPAAEEPAAEPEAVEPAAEPEAEEPAAEPEDATEYMQDDEKSLRWEDYTEQAEPEDT